MQTDGGVAVRPGGGQLNPQKLMLQMQKMQQQIATAQAELAEAEVTGTAGGGLVTVTVSGSGDIKAVKIDPKAVDPDDVETLEDLVLAALHNATEAQRELAEEKMGPVSGGMGGLGLPGF
jgi:nucleoid-associated protein EbfC